MSPSPSPLPAPNRKRPETGDRGFTLIELLVVISIIAILAAIAFPVMGRVRQAAKETQGIANLRQIAVAVQLFGTEYSNKFPPAVSPTTNYAVILSPFLGGTGTTYQEGGKASPIFKDPAAKSQAGSYHYSGNPNFMPDIQQWNSQDPRPADVERLVNRFAATRPAEQVLLTDGAQAFSGSSAATFYSASGVWKKYPHGDSLQPVARGPNVDASSAGGQLRWRAAGGDGVKCLFVDGHVKVMKFGELLQKHVQIDN